MRKLALYALILGIITSMILPAGVLAAKNPCNPCNPCGGKKVMNPCNPCAVKKAMNPCNPCNPCAAGAKHFTINDSLGRNVFTFQSKAPLEKIVGTTSKITGYIHVNPEDITKGSMAKFDLDLASIETGIGLRDQHMRDDYLETGKYPKATLKINKITASDKKLQDKKSIKVNAEGTLSLHGVMKPVKLNGVNLTYFKETKDTRGKMPGNLLHIDGGFVIKLPDYNIKVPRMLVLQLDENIKVNVDLIGTTASATAANPCNPCNPCGGKAMNPCNPCNPCAGKNPCNPCGK